MGVFQHSSIQNQMPARDRAGRETGKKDISQVYNSNIDSSVVVSSIEASRSRLSHPFVLSSYNRRPAKLWARARSYEYEYIGSPSSLWSSSTRILVLREGPMTQKSS